MVLHVQAPLILLRTVKFYWQSATREDRSHKSQNFTVADFFLVGPIRVDGGLIEFSQVVIRPLYRITHGWVKGQAGLVLFTGEPFLVLPLFLPFTSGHLFFSPDLGHQGQVQLHKTAHMSLKPRVSEMERSGKLKEWEQMNHLWIVNQAFESAVCFTWIPCGAE